ncbi:unnamed protein product [Musa textilis]
MAVAGSQACRGPSIKPQPGRVDASPVRERRYSIDTEWNDGRGSETYLEPETQTRVCSALPRRRANPRCIRRQSRQWEVGNQPCATPP